MRREIQSFVGTRDNRGNAVVVVRVGTAETHLDGHYDWGFYAGGAKALALDILTIVKGARLAEAFHEQFAHDVLAGFQFAGFILTDGDVAHWLMQAQDARAEQSRRARQGRSKPRDWRATGARGARR